MNDRLSRSPRAGLAPLEFVLCLPMLLMIMAMIIIVGTAGAWKIRTSVNSRQAIFRAIDLKTGLDDPRPDNWPRQALMIVDRPLSLSPVPIFSGDPLQNLPSVNPDAYSVVRGPSVGAQGAPRLPVRNILDMESGLHTGSAGINRELPVWPRLPYRNHYVRDTPVFSGPAWQHGSFGIGNEDSRILILYEFP